MSRKAVMAGLVGDLSGLLSEIQRRHASGSVDGGARDGIIDIIVAFLRGVGRARRLQRVAGGIVGLLPARAVLIGGVVHGGILRGLRIVRTRRSILVDDALGQKIIDVLALARLIGREEMVERPVFA